jgi:Cu+-exporting ATPase
MKVIDPVCGMSIESEKAHASETYLGRNYYFCSAQCQRSFKADPGKFAAKAGEAGDRHGGHDHHG